MKAAKPAEGSGLTREQFGVALRLVAFAQNEPHPTPEAMEAAASPAAWQAVRRQPLPTPKLLPDVRSASYFAWPPVRHVASLGCEAPILVHGYMLLVILSYTMTDLIAYRPDVGLGLVIRVVHILLLSVG